MKTPKTTEAMVEEFDAFIEKWTGSNFPHLIDTDENDGEAFRNKIRAFAKAVRNNVHTQSALEAEGRKESVRDCGRCNNCETAVSTCEIIIDANGFNKACEADATYHRSKVIE